MALRKHERALHQLAQLIRWIRTSLAREPDENRRAEINETITNLEATELHLVIDQQSTEP